MSFINTVINIVGETNQHIGIRALQNVFKGQDINIVLRNEWYKDKLKNRLLESKDQYLENHPDSEITAFLDLLDNKIDKVGDWGFAFAEGTMDEVSQVIESMGIQIPDSLDFLPGASEIVLGTKLLMNIRAVNNDFEGISNDKKKNLLAAKALVTLSKFGVTTTLVSVGAFAGGAAGAPFAGVGVAIGAPVGSIAGGISAGVLNRRIAPHAKELSYKLLNISKEDLFYYKNKSRIDNIAIKLNNSTQRVRSLEFRPNSIS